MLLSLKHRFFILFYCTFITMLCASVYGQVESSGTPTSTSTYSEIPSNEPHPEKSTVAPQSTSTGKPKNFPFFEEEKKSTPVNDDAFSGAFLNMLGTLALLVCFMFFASYFLKRSLATRSKQLNTTSDIKILEQRSLSHKTALYIVDIQGKIFALAEGPGGLTLLANLNSHEV